MIWAEDTMATVRWRAVYLGGVMHTGTTHAEWLALPETGLLVVARVMDTAPYVTMMEGNDWTVWDGARWGVVKSPAGPISTGEWFPRPDVPDGCAKRGDPTTALDFSLYDAIALAWANEEHRKGAAVG